MIKLIFIGDSNIGKTVLINTFINLRAKKAGKTLIDNYMSTMLIEDFIYELSIWDLGGDIYNKKLRSVSFQQTNVFVLCYSISDINTFKNLKFYYDEIIEYNAPILLCGLKCDENAEVSNKLIEKFCRMKNVNDSIYCSSVNKINIRKVFEKAVMLTRKLEKRKLKFFCC